MNGLQSLKCKPNNLQSLNLTSLKDVLLMLAKLKLQLMNSQSEKLKPAKEMLEKLQ
jgi:hypothetical protein